MSIRLLSRLWRLPQPARLTQRLAFQTNHSASYATAVPRTAGMLRGMPVLQHVARSYSEAVATEKRAERPPTSVEGLLERIDHQYKHNGYVNYEQFTKLLDQLESQPAYNQLLTKEHTLFLLRACGELLPAQSPEERMAVFQRLWNYLQQHNQLELPHYETKLQVLQQNPSLGGIQNFDLLLEEVSKFPAADLLSDLLDVACSHGAIREASKVVATMRERNIALAERHFNALILGNGKNHDLAGCQSVVESMSAAGIVASSETQISLILSYLENEQPAKAVEVLQKYQNQFSANQILRILRAVVFTRSSGDDLIGKLVKELPNEFLMDTEVPVPLRNLCIELLHQEQLPAVVSIIRALPKPEFNENQDIDKFGVFLLQELLRMSCPAKDVISVAKILQDTEKNTRALHVATEIALRRHTPDCLEFLNALATVEPLRPQYFWPIMLHELRRDGEAGLLCSLKLMADYNVECSPETLNVYVLPNLKVSLEDSVKLVKQLDAVGIRPAQVMTPLLLKLLAMQKSDDVLKLAELYPSKLQLGKFVQPLCSLAVSARAAKRLNPYARLVAGLAGRSDNPKEDFVGFLLMEMLAGDERLRRDVNTVKRLLNDLKKFEVSISASAADLIKTSLHSHEGNAKDETDLKVIVSTLKRMSKAGLELPAGTPTSQASSSFIKHPRDMTLDELECHLIELESKRLNTRGVLRRLLQLCVRDNRLVRALEVKHKCDELRVQTSAGMMASILDLYIKLQDLPMAEKCLKRLRKEFPAFIIDEHKMIDFAALFVLEGQLDTAKQLLKERAATQKVFGGDYVVKNVWNFLTQVAKQAANAGDLAKEANLTRDTFQFLRELGYCRPHNTVLGPIVREYLLRGDLKAAVAEFSSLAASYKRTPLQFELMSLLIRLGNGSAKDLQLYPVTNEEAQQLLADVTAVVSKVHGDVNMNSSLLLAFAESGTENQLRRLLINPEFRINQEQLVRNIEHLGQEGAVTTLVRLARGVRGLHHKVDEQGIYKMLLDRFVASNNWEGALQLYEHLEADDELKISQEFLRGLVNLLRVNNVEIPSNVALRAQVI